VYEGLRSWSCSQGILCTWGICRDGCKVTLLLALDSRESYGNCVEPNPDMMRRGPHPPLLVTTDGVPGLIRAFTEVWGQSLRQLRLAH
jgi:putative transposase